MKRSKGVGRPQLHGGSSLQFQVHVAPALRGNEVQRCLTGVARLGGARREKVLSRRVSGPWSLRPHCSWRNHCHDSRWALAGPGTQRGAGYALAPQGRPKLLMCDLLQLNEECTLAAARGHRCQPPPAGIRAVADAALPWTTALSQEASQLYLQLFSCDVQLNLVACLLPESQI